MLVVSYCPSLVSNIPRREWPQGAGFIVDTHYS